MRGLILRTMHTMSHIGPAESFYSMYEKVKNIYRKKRPLQNGVKLAATLACSITGAIGFFCIPANSDVWQLFPKEEWWGAKLLFTAAFGYGGSLGNYLFHDAIDNYFAKKMLTRVITHNKNLFSRFNINEKMAEKLVKLQLDVTRKKKRQLKQELKKCQATMEHWCISALAHWRTLQKEGSALQQPSHVWYDCYFANEAALRKAEAAFLQAKKALLTLENGDITGLTSFLLTEKDWKKLTQSRSHPDIKEIYKHYCAVVNAAFPDEEYDPLTFYENRRREAPKEVLDKLSRNFMPTFTDAENNLAPFIVVHQGDGPSQILSQARSFLTNSY